MAKKKLKSNLILSGIAPNILLQHVENTAPFIFKGELNTEGKERAFLSKLCFYKKNLKALQSINLAEYFHICLAAHWSTAGTFVPTNVDNQIREGLWRHKDSLKFLDIMTKLTLDSWKWDYSQVTNRKSVNPLTQEVISTHEGTWLSVAIGAYCALKKYHRHDLSLEVANLIMKEIEKERNLLLELQNQRSHIAFIRTAPLVAHNLGDLDRVMVQWNMHETDDFCKSIYKLGHIIKKPEYKIFVFNGEVNKAFTSKENHRHMAMRKPKCIRKSKQFLIPVGPFMDDWGQVMAKSTLLNIEEKAEIISALYDGFVREVEAFGYARAFRGFYEYFDKDLSLIEQYIPFNLLAEMKKSNFFLNSQIPREEFELKYIDALNKFEGPISGLRF